MSSSDHQTTGDWESMRRLMGITGNWAYFDHAAVAPLSNPAQQAISQWSDEAVHQGDTCWEGWAQGLEEVRASAAKMIGADLDEIALVPNTTSAISLVAEGIDWREGDNVVTLENEFPSNLYPWMNLASRGVQTRRVAVEEGQVDLNRLVEACDQRTRVVAVSWVGYSSGWRVDVPRLVEMAHQRDIPVMLDAIQALGVFPLDVRRSGIDFLAADGHKWLLGPEGAGIFYVRKEALDRLRPLGVGWNSVVQQHDFSHIELNLRPSAARYEGGSQNMVGMLALGASLKMLAQFGLTSTASPLADRILEITDLACRRLQEIGAQIISHRQGENRSGIVSFDLPGVDPRTQRRRCMQSAVVLNCREGHLRISPHAYVNEEDVDRLILSLDKNR